MCLCSRSRLQPLQLQIPALEPCPAGSGESHIDSSESRSVPGILSDPELVQQFCPWDVQGRKGGGERSRVNTSGYKMKPERHRSGASVPDCYWDSCKGRPWHSAVRAAALPNKPSLFHWCCCISQPFPPSSKLNQTGLLALSVQASLELIMDYGKAGLRVSPLECPGM